MHNYYVMKFMTLDGYHEVHRDDCPLFQETDQTMYLGYFSNALPAIEKAKRFYRHVIGCSKCSGKDVFVKDKSIS